MLSVERVAPDAEADFSTAGVVISGVFVSEVFVSGVFVGEDVGLADAIGRVDDSSG